jgi:hypothetical protein
MECPHGLDNPEPDSHRTGRIIFVCCWIAKVDEQPGRINHEVMCQFS